MQLNEQDFTCPICHDLLLNPITIVCQHTMCRECIAKAVERRSCCPVCRTICLLDEDDIIDKTPNMVIMAALDYFRTPCRNYGCSEKMLTREKEAHETTCAFGEVKCEFCRDDVIRKDLIEHIQECGFHTCYGELYGCTELGTMFDISAHETGCQLSIQRHAVRKEVRDFLIEKLNPVLSNVSISMNPDSVSV